MECETQGNQAGYPKHLNLHWSKTHMCRYKVIEQLIVLKSDNVSSKKILATEFVTLKVSQNLNFMCNISTQWNQQGR